MRHSTAPRVRLTRIPRVSLSAEVEAPPEGAFLPGAWPWLSTRQREVFSRPRTVVSLVELFRERPRGACLVCWRDMGRTASGEDLTCARRDRPGVLTAQCAQFVQACLESGRRQQQAAKASLLAELGEGACHG